MSTAKEHISIEDVLNAYIASETSPTQLALKNWIKLYPQYTKELIDFTVAWSLVNELPAAAEAEAVDEATLVLRAMSIVENRLHALRTQPSKGQVQIKGLLKEVNRLGSSIQQIADACNLSIVIVKKLDQRLIRSSSIPSRVIDCLAKAVQLSPVIVANYLQQQMTLANGGRYHARAAPKLPSEQEDFFDAIRSDPTLDEERRAHWLALDPRNMK